MPQRVVLLHGVGLDRHVWDSTIAQLDPDRYTAQALDLLGHGQSAPAPEGTALADLAAPVVAALEAGDLPVHLVGFSLGALVAQQVAIERPDLLATLTCVSAVCDRTPAEREAVLSRLEGARTDFTGSVQASLRRWYEGTTVSAAERSATERVLLANDQDSYLNCYRVFATADADLAGRLGSITTPTLAVTGSNDPGSTPQMSRRLADAIPHCEVRILDDTRHMLPVQRTEQFVSVLSGFLKEHQ